MGKPACTFCGEYEGVLMDTNLDDGDTQIVCGNDVLMYVLGMASAVTVGMTLEQAEAYAASLDAIYANDPRGPKPPPATGGKRRRNTPPAEPAADGAQADAGDAVALLKPCAQCGGQSAHGDAVKLTCDGCGAVLATADDAAG